MSAQPVELELVDLLPSWARSLRARRRSERTIADYLKAAEALIGWLEAASNPTAPARVTKAHLEEYIVREITRTSPATAASAYRRLQQLFRWLFEEGEIGESPMERMSPRDLTKRPVPVLDDTALSALLAACQGKGFTERRDTAILRLDADVGLARHDELLPARPRAAPTANGPSRRTGPSGPRRCSTGRPTRSTGDAHRLAARAPSWW